MGTEFNIGICTNIIIIIIIVVVVVIIAIVIIKAIGCICRIGSY